MSDRNDSSSMYESYMYGGSYTTGPAQTTVSFQTLRRSVMQKKSAFKE